MKNRTAIAAAVLSLGLGSIAFAQTGIEGTWIWTGHLGKDTSIEERYVLRFGKKEYERIDEMCIQDGKPAAVMVTRGKYKFSEGMLIFLAEERSENGGPWVRVDETTSFTCMADADELNFGQAYSAVAPSDGFEGTWERRVRIQGKAESKDRLEIRGDVVIPRFTMTADPHHESYEFRLQGNAVASDGGQVELVLERRGPYLLARPPEHPDRTYRRLGAASR